MSNLNMCCSYMGVKIQIIHKPCFVLADAGVWAKKKKHPYQIARCLLFCSQSMFTKNKRHTVTHLLIES